MHKVTTARGDVIDFDEVRVKQSLSEVPANIQVKAREQFIDQRLRRKSKRKAAILSNQMLEQAEIEQAEAEQVDVDVPVDEPSTEEVRVKMPRKKLKSGDDVDDES